MKKILILIMTLSALLSASNADKAKKERIEKQIKKEMQKEKKYSQEQKFYQADTYDFTGAEVNPDSVESVPDIPIDDFDMDSVYD